MKRSQSESVAADVLGALDVADDDGEPRFEMAG